MSARDRKSLALQTKHIIFIDFPVFIKRNGTVYGRKRGDTGVGTGGNNCFRFPSLLDCQPQGALVTLTCWTTATLLPVAPDHQKSNGALLDRVWSMRLLIIPSLVFLCFYRFWKIPCLFVLFLVSASRSIFVVVRNEPIRHTHRERETQFPRDGKTKVTICLGRSNLVLLMNVLVEGVQNAEVFA